MSNQNQEVVETLNDLIKINNDRIEGYRKASDNIEANDGDLKAVFSNMASRSQELKTQLNQAVQRLGGEPATDTTVSGKLYRGWMNVKATFSGHDRKSALEACEFGEDAAQKAYKEALKDDALNSAGVRQLVSEQQSLLKADHDRIKAMRDSQPS